MIASGRQIRAARALLGLTRVELGMLARLSASGVKYWERRDAIPTGRFREPVGVRFMREALERLGVTFASEGGGAAVVASNLRWAFDEIDAARRDLDRRRASRGQKHDAEKGADDGP